MDTRELELRAKDLARQRREQKVATEAEALARLARLDLDEPHEFRRLIARRLTKQVFLTLTHCERLAVMRYLDRERGSLKPAVRALFDVIEA